jgi:hypothetical protein
MHRYVLIIGTLFILLASLSLSSCGGCDKEERESIWNDYRTSAVEQTKLFKNGKISQEQLEARYYLWIAWRDRAIASRECPKESPSAKDMRQVFVDQIDPICALVLTRRYMELRAKIDNRLYLENDSLLRSNDSLDSNAELDWLTQSLEWYGGYLGLGNVSGYDAYGGAIPMDTAAINEKVRQLSLQFVNNNVIPVKVELIDTSDHP